MNAVNPDELIGPAWWSATLPEFTRSTYGLPPVAPVTAMLTGSPDTAAAGDVEPLTISDKLPGGGGAGGGAGGGGDEPQGGGVVLGVLNTHVEPFHTYQRPSAVSVYI
jgi:uncharacterized membrane protein